MFFGRQDEASVRTEEGRTSADWNFPGPTRVVGCLSIAALIGVLPRREANGFGAVPEKTSDKECQDIPGRPKLFPLSAAQLRQIIDAATDTAIISIDRAGFVASWSRGAQRIFGWTEEEKLGQKLDRLFTEEDRKVGLLAREMTDALAHGRGGGEEGWRIRKDGSRICAAGEMSPVRGEAGAVVGFTKVVRDRTAQRGAEDAAEQERRSLQILNRAGSALAIETDLTRLVQIVTDAGVELTGAEFGAFFYNLIDEAGESYMLYTLSGAPLEAFSKFPMPRNYPGVCAHLQW